MQIAIDKDIPYANEYFATLGDVIRVDGRKISTQDIADAGVLIVRSVTRVDKALLGKSPVRFVGTVTSGSDHIDKAFLDSRNIGFADAKGSNARAVAEYVLSSLLVTLDQRGESAEGKTAAVIGCGHVGSVVGELLQTLGMRCLFYDPPLQDERGPAHFCDFEDILAADIVTLHVPLQTRAPHPTGRMLSRSLLDRLRQDVILVNTSRGEVVNENDLLEFIVNNRQASCILDVWCREPTINTALLSRTTLGTAHIAGYTLDAKIRATRMVYSATCSYLGIETEQPPGFPVMDKTALSLSLDDPGDDLDLVRMAVLRSYDVRTDSRALHGVLDLDPGQRGAYFDDLRNNYRTRREFTAVSVTVPAGANANTKLKRLGFNLN